MISKMILSEIRWDIGDQFDDAGDGHVTFHTAAGTTPDGREWNGVAIKCDDIIINIEDVEEA
jgi:hypothetical protein